jgi:lipopolysaccharide export LptBFGC system permease protein LptF
LLFGFLIASIFAFRYYSNTQILSFRKELISSSIIVIGLSLLYFGFNNWILPKSNLKMRTLLYTLRITPPGEEIQPIDKDYMDLFKTNQAMMTIKDISLKIDTFDIQFNKYRHQCDSVIAILPDSIAKEKFDALGLKDYGINFSSSEEDTLSERDVRYAIRYLKTYQINLEQKLERKQKYVREKTVRIILPIELILLFIIGASFGFFYNDQKPFLLVILGLYTFSFFYGTILGFEHLISQNTFGNTKGTITSMIILVIVTSIFLIKGLNKEQQISQPDND